MTARSRQRMDEHVRYHFGPEAEPDEPLGAARGIVYGVGLAVAVWFVIFAVWWAA